MVGSAVVVGESLCDSCCRRCRSVVYFGRMDFEIVAGDCTWMVVVDVVGAFVVGAAGAFVVGVVQGTKPGENLQDETAGNHIERWGFDAAVGNTALWPGPGERIYGMSWEVAVCAS